MIPWQQIPTTLESQWLFLKRHQQFGVKHLLDGLPWNLVQALMSPSGQTHHFDPLNFSSGAITRTHSHRTRGSSADFAPLRWRVTWGRELFSTWKWICGLDCQEIVKPQAGWEVSSRLRSGSEVTCRRTLCLIIGCLSLSLLKWQFKHENENGIPQ